MNARALSANPSAARWAAGAFLVFALVSGFQLACFAWGIARHRGPIDEISAETHRFAEIARSLPRAAAVGYLMDRPYAEPQDLDQLERRYFQIAQYAVAPAVLDLHPRLPLLLANFKDPASLERWSRDPGYELLRDYGGGVALFARKGR